MQEDRSAWIRFGIRWDGGRRPKRLLAQAAAALLILGVGATAASARPAPARVDVVVASTPSRVAAAERLVQRLGGTVHQRLAIVDGFSASIPSRAMPRLRASDSVLAVSGDASMKVRSSEAAAASSALVSTAAGMDGSPLDGAGVGVALIDSGVVPVGGLSRPGALVRGPDFSDEARDQDLYGMDTFGHGTHLAGLIAGYDPLSGFYGAAPGAHVVSVKVAGADGLTSLQQVLEAFDWVRRQRKNRGLNIRVLNVSLGVEGGGDYRTAVLAYAAEKLWKDGVAIVAAAGNEGAAAPHLDLPAADPYVIAVGATDSQGTADPSDDRVADFSSRSAVRPPDVVAPGTRLVSLRVPGSTLDEEFPEARVGESFFRGSGTSQAAAVVSGLAARLIGQRPNLSPDQLKALLVAGAVDLVDPREADGAGRVDLARSAALATPDARQVRQTWASAKYKVRNMFGGRHSRDDDDDDYYDGEEDDEDERGDRGDEHEVQAGDGVFAGRRWSGRRWSGRRWSGMKWSGMKWSGMKWSAAAWTDVPTS